MIKISNSDCLLIQRLLSSFILTNGKTIREQEDRRRAKLLIRKLSRKRDGP